jgi:hypothetical protein
MLVRLPAALIVQVASAQVHTEPHTFASEIAYFQLHDAVVLTISMLLWHASRRASGRVCGYVTASPEGS